MKKALIYIPVLLIILISCKKELLNENPPNLATAETVYTSLQGFELGINGLYAEVRKEREGYSNATTNLRASFWLNGTDDGYSNGNAGPEAIFANFATFLTPAETGVSAMFNWLYESINAANTIIDRAANPNINWGSSQPIADANKNRILAEARTVRAWGYMHLTYLFGDVPLILHESKGSNINTDWIRTPVAQVREQMKQDWIFASNNLPVDPSIQGKMTKGVAQTWLAELYLATGKPDSALYWANQCINTPQYQLITSRYGVNASKPGVAFMDMFLPGNSNRNEGNKEALWVLQWESNFTGGGESIWRRWTGGRYDLLKIGGITPLKVTAERGGKGLQRLGITKYAVDIYDKNDDRGSVYAIRKYFVFSDNGNPQFKDLLPTGYKFGDTIKYDYSKNEKPGTTENWPYSLKHMQINEIDPNGATQHNDQIYMRLAETYLLKAEAQFLLGDAAGAASTINVLRRRAHTTDVAAANVNMDFILDERSRELLFEEHRRYTLNRTNTWLQRVQKYNHAGGQFATERDKLFPIPQSVIDANLTTKMPQNPGY
jgi:hypothetical protein